MVIINDEEGILSHYGILRKSGRYPWGSGGDVPQRSKSFLDIVDQHKKDGWTEKQICEAYSNDDYKMTVIQLRAMRTIAGAEWKASQIAQVQAMKERGWGPTEISKRMGIPEPTVRSYLKPGADDKKNKIYATSEMLREEVKRAGGILDISKGTENHLGVTKEKKDAAVAMLVEEGYVISYVKIPQLGFRGSQGTTQKVLALPGTTRSEIYARRGDIETIKKMSPDHGESWYGIKPPISINSNRVKIINAEDGGNLADGVIYVRPGVPELSMNGKNYAQVRIMVDNTHYIKGMAIYKDDLPKGVDLVVNSAKSKADAPTTLSALKKIKDDPADPFGTAVDQVRDKDGKVTSAMNLVNEEGDWAKWSNTISSQVLSKQNPALAKQQLNMTMERRLSEYSEISSLTNLTVRRRLLEDFASTTDSAAVHLKAAALPGQRWHVILPVNSLKDDEIFAPNYNNGERVAVIRYPHGGTFEIPDLKVNNKNAEARRIVGPASQDAVGFNPSVAARLSGADFDGDTVLVIRNNHRTLKIDPPLKDLEGFDPKTAYPKYPGMKVLTPKRKQQEMGNVTNLITDMQIKGASHAEIARAVKHSMVVIDAEKHELNYKQSAIDNGIRGLKDKYQAGQDGSRAASTLISRSSASIRVPERLPSRSKEGGPVNKETGKLQFTPTNATYIDKKTGKVMLRTTKSKQGAETDDAHTLSSGTPMEKIYADHANRLKALANQARRDAVNTPRAEWSPSAKETYAKEVASLNAKHDLALRNAPLERRAQSAAGKMVRLKKEAEPNMDEETEKKLSYRALETMRARMGVSKQHIQFTPAEWDAIQAGAISDSKLSALLDHADMDNVRKLATPRTRLTMTPTKITRATSMLNLGYTRVEVAEALGVPLSTLDTSLYPSE